MPDILCVCQHFRQKQERISQYVALMYEIASSTNHNNWFGFNVDNNTNHFPLIAYHMPFSLNPDICVCQHFRQKKQEHIIAQIYVASTDCFLPLVNG